MVAVAAATVALQVASVYFASIPVGIAAIVVFLAFFLLALRASRPSHSYVTHPVAAPAAVPVAVPVAAPAARPPAPKVRVPENLQPDSLTSAVLESASVVANVLSAAIWLEDPSSGSLRLVSASGPGAPDPHPVPLDDDPIGLAVSEGLARLTEIPTPQPGANGPTVWRFAVPVSSNDARGAVAVDLSSAGRPDTERLAEIVTALRGGLTGSLALYVAHQEVETARMLLDTARQLSRARDRDQVLEHTLSRAMAMSDAETGSIMLVDAETGRMCIVASHGLPEDIVSQTVVGEGEGIAGWVLTTRQPVLIEDLPGKPGPVRRSGVRSAVTVPIADEDGILGVMNVGSRAYPARFTSSHMTCLEVLGTQTAIALRNARALDSARDLYFATLKALALAMETKDPYAHGGTQRVVDTATALARAMHVEDEDLHALEIAALLHDIGMAAAGESVAACSRPLSTFERGLLKLHPVLAAEILEEVPALAAVVPIVYHHHEWYDGEGYVVGLAGDAIPLGARILAVADAFVAMTSERPYRPALPEELAMHELRDKAGSQFDPVVVETFVEMRARERALAARAGEACRSAAARS